MPTFTVTYHNSHVDGFYFTFRLSNGIVHVVYSYTDADAYKAQLRRAGYTQLA